MTSPDHSPCLRRRPNAERLLFELDTALDASDKISAREITLLILELDFSRFLPLKIRERLRSLGIHFEQVEWENHSS